ncbi:MAG TPA: glycosyltransferase [Phycisphaerales bacterium]|nr:glycosyltransferase [Phycisphaerales bacterium]
MSAPLSIVFLGLSVTSSWGNGHATNYRGLMRTLTKRGHQVTFLERDRPWYADNRDLPKPPWGRTHLYRSLQDLKQRFTRVVRNADVVVLGSYVPKGIQVAEWLRSAAKGVRVFYDIDTPVTLAALADGTCEYLSPHQVPYFDVYLSFTGGPTLRKIERAYGSPAARAFYCLVDPAVHRPHTEDREPKWDLGYLGTYSADRQPGVRNLLIRPALADPALRMIVAGPQYPDDIEWPENVRRIEHLPPSRHRTFYTSQRFTLNVTRAHMRKAGYSPSVRLFEAAACGTPIISDIWAGIEEVLEPGSEILLADSSQEVLRLLTTMPEGQRRAIGERARQRILREHTAEHRAMEFEQHVSEARARNNRAVIAA